MITTENLGKDQKIWYNLYQHVKCRIKANQEKKQLRKFFSASKIDNKQKILLLCKKNVMATGLKPTTT